MKDDNKEKCSSSNVLKSLVVFNKYTSAIVELYNEEIINES